MTSFNNITPKRPYLQIQSYWALGIRPSTCGFGGCSWVHSSTPGTVMSGKGGRRPQATCPLRPSSPGTAPPWQRAEGRHASRHTGTPLVLHPLQQSDYQEAVQSQGLRPVILLGTSNVGCGSEQAAVGSPPGDCRPCHRCPTQRVSSHQCPLVTAEGCPWGHQLPCTSRHRLVARGTSRPRTHSKKLLRSRATESDRACGLVTTLPEQMPLWGEGRHPTGISPCGQAQTSFKNDQRPQDSWAPLGASHLPTVSAGSHGPKLAVRSDWSPPGSVHIA